MTSAAPARRRGVRPTASRASQRGLGLLGLLFFAGVIVVAALVGMQILPTATEFMAVKRALHRAVEGADSPAQVQSAFDRFAAVDDIKSVNGRDLVIDRDPKTGKLVGEVRYTRKIELFGPASLLLEYHGTSADR